MEFVGDGGSVEMGDELLSDGGGRCLPTVTVRKGKERLQVPLKF